MGKGYTLDTRRSLYGEPRLSDAQVRVLRDVADGPWPIEPDATSRALIHRHMMVEIVDPSEFVCSINERGRKALAAIDRENTDPSNKAEF